MSGILPIDAFFNVKSVRVAHEVKPQAAEAVGGSFGDLLGQMLDATNSTEAADQLASIDIANANVNDLHNSMIAAVKAETALRFTLQVRNKVVEAYQEIARMQV